MGSGGYAAVSAKAALAAQKAAQKKVVEKAAFSSDFEFDAVALSTLPPVNEACDAFFCGDPFEGAELDSSLWEPSQDVPAWGTLAVDHLFTMPGSLPGSLPGSMPGSPIKAAGGPISPLGSPLRAPGSPAARYLPAPVPTVPAAAPEPAAEQLLAAAPAVPTVTAIPTVDILTSHASIGEPEVVVVWTPRAPKRAAGEEAEADARLVRQRSSDPDSDGSESSDATAASLEGEDIVPALIAAPLTSQGQVEAALPSMPTSQQTAAGEVVTLSPTLWRDAHPPYRIHVNAGLHSMRAPGVEAPITLFGAIHPRIVTTGQPHRRLGRSRLGRQADSPAPPTTRATRAHSSERAPSGDLGAATRREKAPEREGCVLQEVWLLKRSLERGQASAVVDSQRCCGPFDGTTLTDAPAWAGAFAVDIAACVADGCGGSFWVKAQNRSVQDIFAS